jgi:hypothetical protein
VTFSRETALPPKAMSVPYQTGAGPGEQRPHVGNPPLTLNEERSNWH